MNKENCALKLVDEINLVLMLGMNGVIPSLPHMPYGIYTDKFAFLLYVYGNSSIEQGSLICCHCSV